MQSKPTLILDCDRTGKTALHYCCTSDSIRAAQAADLLVMAAPELIENRDEDGFTPLHLAVIAGNVQLVTFLLANNADVNALDNEKHTVVHWATVCGETAALRAVLAAGAPVSTPDLHGGYPLHYAAQMCGGDKDSLGMQVLQTLLTHKNIDVTVTDGDKRQPLLWAASAGSAKALLALIRAGAAVEASDKDGLTALHCAASRGHTDCLDTLLTLCGAQTDIIDSNGCTALHYAVTLGHADATALLLAHGADPNRQDRRGRSPAHCGCAKGQFETVKLIGSHGANLWLRNARGDLPLHEAAASGRRELINWLLNMRPSQVNARNNDGKCPLHMAALNDNADMCKILLDAGAYINPILRTSKNIFMTPLDCALQKGFRSTAKFLQLHGGVPASRIGDPSLQPTETASALSLHIRDDITFWGDSSSDSEKEVADLEKAHRKIKKRKLLAQRHMRKKPPLSESEEEIGVGTDVKREKSGELKKSKEIKEDVKHKASESIKNPPSSRLEYTNEIIINGKTEINIHQTKEISIEREGTASKVEVQEKISLPSSGNVIYSAVDKEKRPKSAKYSKVKEKHFKDITVDSAKAKIEDSSVLKPTEDTKIEIPKAIDRMDSINRASLRQQSTNTSEETAETVIDTYKTVLKGQTEVPESVQPETQVTDELSLKSNTSEEIEQAKDIVVEASVHPQPKSIKSDDLQNEEVKSGETVQTEQSKEVSDSSPTQEANIEEQTVNGKDIIEENAHEEKETLIHDTEQKKELSTKIPKTPTSEQIDDNVILEAINDDQILNGDSAIDKDDTSPAVDAAKDVSNEDVQIDKDDDIKDTQVEEVANKDKSKDKKVRLAVFHDSLEEDESETQEDSDAIASKSVSQDQDITLVEKYASYKGGDKTNINNSRITNATVKKSSPKNKVNDVKKEHQMKSSQKLKEDVKEVATKKYKTKGTEKSKTKENVYPTSKKQRKLKEGKEVDREVYSSDGEDTPKSESVKSHKSFLILHEEEEEKKSVKSKTMSRRRNRRSKSPPEKELRSKSEETRIRTQDKYRGSKIPTPLFKTPLSTSDRHLDRAFKVIDREVKSNLDSGVLSLPNIYNERDRLREPTRSESNMSAPLMPSVYSDNERGSPSDLEEDLPSSSVKRKKLKKRQKSRGSRSAGSDYESSNLIDSGFEPSPRSTRIPKWRNMSDRGVNMTSVTQTIQNNIRRYHLERKIFQHLLELKRNQIRAGKHNEAVLVKRAIDQYHQSCASTVGAGRYIPQDYSLKSFEKFLYESLRKLQKTDAEYLKGLPESSENANPLLCTQSTHRCMHATHAYTGIPCAAYLPKMDHHSIPKIGFNSVTCKPGTAGFLPNINQKKAVTLELSHGNDKQVISLPTDRMDQNKRYYVTFTVKGSDQAPSSEENAGNNENAHRHSKSD